MHAPIAMNVVAGIGLVTAVFAATIGMVQTDIKRVFAYSTVSQLGYMFLGVGVGAFGAGIFHLVTHAFFKALLFLGSGSVIHALGGEQDMRKMGGLRSKAPVTFWTMLAGAAAISALPFTSGFYSKDEILLGAFHKSPILFWIGILTAGMTAFYVFRAIFLVFFGEYRGGAHAHESPPVMTLPLIALALLSLGGGAFEVSRWLEPMFPKLPLAHNPALVFASVGSGVLGVAIAWVMYVWRPRLADLAADRLGWLYKLAYRKYFVDEIYDAAVVRPLVGGSREWLWHGVDQELIDGAVNGVGTRSRGIGNVLRLVQSGNIRSYAAWVLLGSVCVLIAWGAMGGLR
jgi:NADH-quinone oxidoreductase subunit L